MSLYKRGNVYWYDFWFLGSRHRDSTRTSNKRTAEQVLAAFKTALAKGEVGIRKKKDVPTFGEFWEQALCEIKADNPDNSRTIDFYETNFQKSVRFSPLAKAKLDAIDEELLARFRQHLIAKEELAAPTINRRLGAIRRVLYIAKEWKLIVGVPTFPMMSEKGHGREFVLTPALKREFLARAPEKYRIIFEFLLETGLRISECVKLTWDRVFLAAGADASTIQVIAGHEDIRTSQKYLHPTPQHVLMAFERMHTMRKQTEEREKRERRVRSEPRQMWRVPTIFPTVTDREFQDVGKLLKTHYAKVAELADAPDLGSGGETREGSSPSFRTKKPVPVLSSQL